MKGFLSVLLLSLACAPVQARNQADSLPELLGESNPFRYPADLFERRVEGEVTLRLHVDSLGRVPQESVLVAESSGEPLLDSAAVHGATGLQFRPAQLGGRAVPLTILFPVKFRIPVDSGEPAKGAADGPERN